MLNPDKYKPPRKLGLTKAILENALAPIPRPITQLAVELNCSADTLYALCSKLRRQGRLSLTKRQTVGAVEGLKLPDSLPGSQVAQDNALNLALDKEVPMDRLTRIKSLTRIAKIGQDANKIQAIKALEELERGSGTQVGPPPPVSEEEKTQRLARLMVVVGQPITDAAHKLAFTPEEADNAQDQAPEGH
jgi:hypothetical protein